MTSRRELLQFGLATAVLPMAASADIAPAQPARRIELYKVLYDTRFPASVEFARRASARGLAVHAITGDMTRFWYDDLYHRWRRAPAAIAGLTAHGALFCLERLAWDQRMRVAFRGEHRLTAAGRVTHVFEGPGSMLPVASLTATGATWASALADVLAECPGRRTAKRNVGKCTTTAAPSLTEPLFSWVIAPVARA